MITLHDPELVTEGIVSTELGCLNVLPSTTDLIGAELELVAAEQR